MPLTHENSAGSTDLQTKPGKGGLSRATGILFLVSTLIMLGSWIGLMNSFEYPEILRKDSGHILSLFLAGGLSLKLLWTGMVLSSVLLTLAMVLQYRVLSAIKNQFLFAGIIFGIMCGLVQIVGLIRWVLVVPSIAEAWQAAPAGSAQQIALEIVFKVVNLYGGVALGETLGFIFTGVWIICLGIAILQTRIMPRLIGVAGIISGLGVMSGVLEHLGAGWAVGVNAAAFMVLLLLFVYFGLSLLVKPILTPQDRLG